MLGNDSLKVSKFCRFIDSSEQAIVINTLHRSITQLDKEVWNSLQTPSRIGKGTLTTDELELLKLAKVLVRKDIDETRLFRDWLQRIKHDTSSIRATIVLTSRCNFNCSYCFENGYMKKFPLDMKRKTASVIVSWLKTFALENESREIKIYLYGGEPTLRIDLIDFLTRKFKCVFRPLKIKVEFYMYTNGAVLTKKLLNIMKTHNFKHLQITLDGPPDIHNRRRPFRNGKGSFDIIFENIRRILKETKTRVLLLVNFDQENYQFIPWLLDIFKKEGLSENTEFAFNPVFRTQYNKNHCDRFSLSDAETYNIWRSLYTSTLGKGLRCTPLTIFETGPCSFRRASHLIFDPKGNIYKCIGFLGTEEFRVGNVNDNFFATIREIEKQVSFEPWDNEKCSNCVFLPLCLGGCRFHSYVESSNITDIFCHWDLIESVEIPLIRHLVQSRKAK